MKVRVEYKGQLRTALDRSEDAFDLPAEADVAALFRALVQHVGPVGAPHLVAASGQPASGLLVVVNGAAVPAAQAQTMRLQPGDVVTLLPPIAGG